MDLSGLWRAAPADEELRRTFHLPDFDDEGWEAVSVPGHWADVPALADTDEVLYRYRFGAPGPPRADTRSWLELDGLFYQGDVFDVHVGATRKDQLDAMVRRALDRHQGVGFVEKIKRLWSKPSGPTS